MRSSRSSLSKAGGAFLCFLLLASAGCGGRSLAPSDLGEKGTLHVAVLPVENLSGGTAPLAQLRRTLTTKAAAAGVTVVPEETVDRFIREHRIRHTGGIDEATSRLLKTQLKADAALITSLELYTEDTPPKMAVMSRLVTTGESSRILWMESVALAGDEEPGLLNLGTITDSKKLQEKVLERAVRSLANRMSGEGIEEGMKRYEPKIVFSDLGDVGDGKPVIAVLPFINQSMRKNAGEMVVLHCVKQLVDSDRFSVVEPGTVRSKMLQMRIIMDEGVTLPQVDLIARTMQADYIMTGKVFEYQDYFGSIGTPKVDFSLQVIEGSGKKVVWASKSYNEGNDGVFFYDWGRTYTASDLARKMTRTAVQQMLGEQ